MSWPESSKTKFVLKNFSEFLAHSAKNLQNLKESLCAITASIFSSSVALISNALVNKLSNSVTSTISLICSTKEVVRKALKIASI